MLKLTNGDIADMERKYGVELKQRQGRPLFLNCKAGKAKDILLEVDSGADRCIVTRGEVKRLGLRLRKFRRPQGMLGVGGDKMFCEDFCILSLTITDMKGKNFKIHVLCYVVDSNVPNLLGSDLLSHTGAVVDYRDETLTMEGRKMKLTPYRKGLGKGNEGQSAHFCSKSEVSLPARVCRLVEVVVDGNVGDGNFALLGGELGDLVVMDAVWDGEKERYEVAVMNMAETPRNIKANQNLGKVLMEGEGAEFISLDSLISDPIYLVKEVGEGVTDIPDRKKLSAGELDKFYKHGCRIRLPQEGEDLPINTEKEEIDEEKEILRNKNSKMWPNREDFLSNFKWREMEEELKGDVGEEQSQEFSNKMQQLFWDYKGVFWDGDWKNWTRARIRDLDIGLIEGSEPAIDKFRPMNEEKQVALKEFMNNLIAGG